MSPTHQGPEKAVEGAVYFPEPPVLKLTPRIISFRGKIRSGKSTAALYLQDKYVNVRKVSFADALRVELYDLLNSQVLLRQFNEDYKPWPPFRVPTKFKYHLKDDEYKIAAIHALDKNEIRDMLQFYGTDFRRNNLGGDTYWVDKYLLTVNDLMDQGFVIVTDDARFENEREVTDYEIYIESNALEMTSKHESERLAHDKKQADAVISNLSTLDSFYSAVESTVFNIKDKVPNGKT